MSSPMLRLISSWSLLWKCRPSRDSLADEKSPRINAFSRDELSMKADIFSQLNEGIVSVEPDTSKKSVVGV